MTERARGPIEVSAVHVGATDLGPAAAVVDDDGLTVVVHTGDDARSIRLRIASIAALDLSGDTLSLRMRDGTRVTIGAPAGAALHDDILRRCRALPELTRTLRAFGSRRGSRSGRAAAPAEQQRFFEPFIAARRSALHVEGLAVIGAFDGAALTAALDDTLRRFAADRHIDAGPARRALEAELSDLSEPLRDALLALGQAGTAALESTDDLALWRAWSAQLHATFEIADRVWMALDSALAAAARFP